MRKFSDMKIKIFIFILALIAASIACNHPDAIEAIVEVAIEKCFTVNRSRYESAAAQLGQNPETPEYPESAVYEVCYIDMEVSSVRMSGGDRPKDEELAGGDESTSTSTSTDAGEGISIPAGTYTGEFPWNDSSTSELLANEIIIEVSGNGLVSGSATEIHSSTDVFNTAEGECTYFYEFGTSYTINGQITDVYREPVEVQKSLYEVSDHSDCGGEHKRREEECVCEGSLTIADGLLTITCGAGNDCGVYLTAKNEN